MKFSVIMVTYRRPHTLPRAIESVLNQTYRNLELVVVNNDAAPVEVPDDPRIRLFQHADRASESHARNKALGHATGDAICWADDDDVMTRCTLEVAEYVFRVSPNAKLVHGGIVLPDCHVNFDVRATPSCVVRRAYATPDWSGASYGHDQAWWRSIIERNGWTEAGGEVVRVNRVFSVVYLDPRGGLRAGGL